MRVTSSKNNFKITVKINNSCLILKNMFLLHSKAAILTDPKNLCTKISVLSHVCLLSTLAYYNSTPSKATWTPVLGTYTTEKSYPIPQTPPPPSSLLVTIYWTFSFFVCFT